ncbi:hypothetical protein AHAS_Ahas20G0091900 [Arachis hypogaea]
MFYIHQQTLVQHSKIKLYVEFEHITTDGIQHDPHVEDDRVEVYEGMNYDIEEDFEATYNAGDEDNDGDGGGEAVIKNVVVPLAVSQPMDVLHFMRSLDLDTMHAPKLFEYANIGDVDLEDRKFSYTISKGVDCVVYQSEPQALYAKCKKYGHGCDWLIRVNLIQKKGCWEIERYNGRHTCSMGMISQDHSKLDLDSVAKAMRPLVESDISIKVKSIITEVQSKFNYTISY